MRLERVSDLPILEPRSEHSWEAGAVFNCAAITWNGLVHLIYRATDIASDGSEGPYVSQLGYAVSSDGLTFNRLEHPVLESQSGQEQRGPEDPRVVVIEDVFYMLYTGYGGRFEGDYRICAATSANLITWRRLGVLLDEQNKDATLFPERIGGRFLMLHRRPPGIWIAESDDLRTWTNHTVLMRARADSPWDNLKIGAAGPPIRTADGWLLIYHGVSESYSYSLGAALLDLEHPTQIIARQSDPILEPQLSWEIEGHVPNVVFSCGQVEIDGQLCVYYGAADTVIGVATTSLTDLTFD
jgi:predicted GH43/DUF377 family glycosyl hydrolase